MRISDWSSDVCSSDLDYAGLVAITAVLGLVMGGLIAIRLQGIDSLLAWGLIIAGLLALVPFGRLEAAQAEPLVDVRLLGQPTQWPKIGRAQCWERVCQLV